MEGIPLGMQNLTSCHYPELTYQYTNTIEKARNLKVLSRIGDGGDGDGGFLSDRTPEGWEGWTHLNSRYGWMNHAWRQRSAQCLVKSGDWQPWSEELEQRSACVNPTLQ